MKVPTEQLPAAATEACVLGRLAAAELPDDPASRAVTAAAVLVEQRAQLIADPAGAQRAFAGIRDQLGVPPLLLACCIFGASELLVIDPHEAVLAVLTVAMALAGADEVALWRSADGVVERVGRTAGANEDDKDARMLALQLIGSRSEPVARRELVGAAVPVPTGGRAALIARAEPDRHDLTEAVLTKAAPVTAALLERDRLRAGEAAMQRVVDESRDRRLRRLGLDVHDGPLQDLAALGQDVAFFRGQLARSLEGHERADLILGRVDDLEAQLVAVDADLRRIAISLQSPFMATLDFELALSELIDSYRASSGIALRAEVSGDPALIADEEQMALLSIIREALTNVRKHARASEVLVTVRVTDSGVSAEILDDGAGFDVESSLLRAARNGRLGLVGMLERVRDLDGHSRIDSRPGGPTTVVVDIPRPPAAPAGA